MTSAGQVSLPHAIWRKSSYSSPTSNDCVEVATNLPGIVAVRDSKQPDGAKLAFTRSRWRRFVRRVKTGAYDL
jgi:hypothetical protein